MVSGWLASFIMPPVSGKAFEESKSAVSMNYCLKAL
jgi:hypothetical protein